jgi:AraC-like DNA-binding protein
MTSPELTEFARADLSCGSFDALRATHFQHRFPPHFHDTFALGVVESGMTRLRTHRGEWVASGGTILAFSPGEVHAADPIGDEGFTYRMVYPSAADLAAAGIDVARVASGLPLFRAPVIHDKALAAAFQCAHVPLMRDRQRGVAESRLVKALAQLARAYGYGEDRGIHEDASPGDTAMVAVAQRYLHEHIGMPVRLEPLAALLGVSTFRLVRSFQRVVGVSPYAYFVQLRVNRAQAMLCQGASITDVVFTCGFCDQSHFTRTFRRMIGVPPGRYVRAVRNSAA